MNTKILVSTMAAASLAILSQAAMSQPSDSSGNASAVPADNTKSNKVDPSNRTATADAQKENPTDRTLTQRVRKRLIADKSLSTYAHNVKVVTAGGTVTLNGVVRSDEEKSTVESEAVAVAGKGKVVNDLKVSPAKP